MRAPRPRSVALVALLAAAGCKKASEAPAAPAPTEYRLEVVALLDGKPASCSALAAPPFVLRDARLFVSDLRVAGPDGEVAAALVPDGRFQSSDVALLDFEDATGGCEGDAATHTTVVFTAPIAQIQQLRFTVGVPFSLNHANPALAVAPLTAGAMHWGWRAGYKFVRVEAQKAGHEARVHLGSTQCEGAINAITGCAHPNRPEVEVALDPTQQRLGLELGALFSADPAQLDCMGDTDDVACQTAYAALGLGRPATAFHAVPR